MSDKLSKEKELYRSYSSKVEGLLQDKDAANIFDSLKSGKNSYMRIDRVESSSFDLSWIDMIEQCIPDLGTIVNNPRLNTKTVEDLVPVELARKTNADSIKHLSSHTQFIKEITEEGDVIPNKVLNIGSDDEIRTYENRFIATLIRHLVLFVEKRYEFVSRFAVLHNHEILYFKNDSIVNGSQVNIETKVTVISPKADPLALKNSEYIKRIEQMRQFILYFYNSKFMKSFKNDKDVRNPIIQTNIIRKNPLYHHCYELYRFIESYDRLGVSYKVDEDYSQFDSKELRELNCLMFANYIALQGKDKSPSTKKQTHSYKPKILTSSDDEAFVYGPLLKGPIEFVRVDEAYQRYLDSKVSKDLKDDMNQQEKHYYSQELDVRKLNRKEFEEKIKLLERKKWQKIQFDKEVAAKIKQREEEEERLRQMRIDARLKEEEEYLRAFRQRLVDEALRFKANGVKDEEETDFATSIEPSAFSVQKKDFDFSKLSSLEKELALQKLRLTHVEEEEKKRSSSSLDNANRLEDALKESKDDQEKVVISTPLEKEEPLPVVKVLPVAPTSSQDLLTAGLDDEDDIDYDLTEIPAPLERESSGGTPSLREEKEDINSLKRKIRPIPVPVKVEEEDEDDRLDSDEKKAVLVYDLLQDEKPVKVPSSVKKLPKVPFYTMDEDILDPFERIRNLNEAYRLYDKKYGPFHVYDGLYQALLLDGLEEERHPSYLVYSKERGYYSEEGFVSDKDEATVFEDFDNANRVSLLNHGEVLEN